MSFICASHFTGQNLGKAVVAFAEDLCKKAGIEALRLEVGHENQPAQSLYRTAYRTAGFKGRRTKFDDQVAVRPGRHRRQASPPRTSGTRRGRPVAVKET